MDITMIGLQNAGKTSLLRVLAVSPIATPFRPDVSDLMLYHRAASLRSSMCDRGAFSRDPVQLNRRGLMTFQLDTDGRLQHEAGPEGPCDPEVVCFLQDSFALGAVACLAAPSSPCRVTADRSQLGSWWPTKISLNVGKVLPRSERYRVGCCQEASRATHGIDVE